VSQLKTQLIDKNLSMFKRYRALFSLRNIGNSDAVLAICEGFKDSSALFRHEIAYVLGQIQHRIAISYLKIVLENKDEHSMVRHEAAEALGSIASDQTLPLMKKYAKDNERVVRESCEVALDIADYMTSESLEYADTLVKLKKDTEK